MCQLDDPEPCTHQPGMKRFSFSRRRRLWELARETHCPVIGVCIPLPVLRRIVAKAVGRHAPHDDYEIHVGAISECTYRNRLSELLQDELDRRYTSSIKLFKNAKTSEALKDMWETAIKEGDVAGAFWAGLSHARCDIPMQEAMCRDMHMLQHQAGATTRAEIHRFHAVLEENAMLTRELARHQVRYTRFSQEKSQELELLQKQLTQLRAEVIGKDSLITYLQSDLQQLKDEIPELSQTKKQQQKLQQALQRQQDLEQQVRELKRQLTQAEALLNHPLSNSKETSAEESLNPATKHRTIPITLELNERNVLCVGGRSGNVANYRDLIEGVGGRFIHHDGGVEDNASLLESSLAAADLVICQTGCISHSAYWRVKEFCKRTGKRCVFIDNPSISSLARGLQVNEQSEKTE